VLVLFFASTMPAYSYGSGPALTLIGKTGIPIPQPPLRSSVFSVGNGDNLSLLVEMGSAETTQKQVAASGYGKTPVLQLRHSQDVESGAVVTGDSDAGTFNLDGIPLPVALVLVALIGLVPVARRGTKTV